MKPLAAILALVLAGGAHTTLYGPDGRKLAEFQGDMQGLRYSNGAVTLEADRLDHSTATKAQGEAASGKIASIGTAIAASGAVALLK